MKIIFRGTRGTSPSPGEGFVKYGGNTSCVEVKLRDMQLFFDAGTGISSYRADKSESSASNKYFIFLSHLHYDHIQGLPFFAPMFDGDSEVHIYGSKSGGLSLQDAFEQFMRPPYHPLSRSNYPAKIAIHEIEPGEIVYPGEHIQQGESGHSRREDCRIETFALQHPGGSLAYKLTDLQTGKTFVYATDSEMPHGERKEALVDFLGAADLLVIDSFFTNEEMNGELDGKDKRDWGHMSFEEAAELAGLAEVKQLALFHHHNKRKDDEIDELQERARGLFKASFCAYDNQIVEI